MNNKYCSERTILLTTGFVFVVLITIDFVGIYFGEFYNQKNAPLWWWVVAVVFMVILESVYSLIFSVLISSHGRKNKTFVVLYTLTFAFVTMYFAYRHHYSPMNTAVSENWLWAVPYLAFVFGAAVAGMYFRRSAHRE